MVFRLEETLAKGSGDYFVLGVADLRWYRWMWWSVNRGYWPKLAKQPWIVSASRTDGLVDRWYSRISLELESLASSSIVMTWS